MLIKKEKALKKQISDSGFVYEYIGPSDKLNLAVSELNGRIPEEGWVRNNVCQEAYYVISGQAKLVIDDQEYKIGEGDVAYIEAGKKYYLEADNLKLLIPTAPAFYPEQWENIK